MARPTNIFIVIKNVEAFVKSVPIDPRDPSYRDWLKCRAQMKKALKNVNDMLKTLRSLEDIEKRLPSELLVPCRGKVILRQILEAILLPCRKVPAKSTAPFLCGKPGPRQVA